MNAKMLLLNDGKRRAFIIAAVVELATCPSIKSEDDDSAHIQLTSVWFVSSKIMGKRVQIKCSPPNQILTMYREDLDYTPREYKIFD